MKIVKPLGPNRDLEFFMGGYHLESQATPNNFMFGDISGLLDQKFGRSIPAGAKCFFSQIP